MSLFAILVLAIVQGITEFLPISSSGHLVLVRELFPALDASHGAAADLTLDIALHVGTLLAVLVYTRHDITGIARGFLAPRHVDDATRSRRLGLQILLATVPIILVGVFAKDLIINSARSLTVIGWTTLIFGILLGVADRMAAKLKLEEMGWGGTIIIGLAQVLALIPGTSRSGICMTAGRALGLDRTQAARFALLLSIPTILGAGMLAGLDLWQAGNVELTVEALIGGGLAFLFAWLAIIGMMGWLARATFMPFVLYRLILGVALLAMVYI